MNKISKLRNILFHSKTVIRLLSKDNQDWKALFNKKSYKQKTLIIGTTVIGVGLIGYGIVNASSSYKNLALQRSIIDQNEQKTFADNLSLENIQVANTQPEPAQQEEQDPLFYVNNSTDKTLNGIPIEVPYLIIGGGVAGMSAARTIRANDPLAKVLIINDECQNPGSHKETYPPYRRILLSKYIWRRNEESQKTLLNTSGDAKQSSYLFLEPDSFFIEPEKLNQCEYGGISLLNGHRVIKIDPKKSTVTLENSNHQIAYKACLIATGSSPKRIRHLEISDNTNINLYKEGHVSYFRSLNDFRNLAEKTKQLRAKDKPGKILIIGAGLLGTELVASLSRVAKDQGNLEIIEVFKEKSHLYKILPEQLSNYIFKILSGKQIKLIPEAEVVSIGEIREGSESNRLAVSIKQLTNSNETQENIVENVDHVIIAAGVEPDTSLADFARLEIDKEIGGFLVNSELQSRESIFVAGDCCSFYDVFLGRRRVEHWNHSEESGNVAGHNMAAFVLKLKDQSSNKISVDNSNVAYDVLKPRIYDFQSSFSFKLNLYNSIEAMGLIDSRLETKAFIATDFFDDNLDSSESSEKRSEDKNVKPIAKHDPLDMPGVVFYLKNNQIVGVLLWNCDDDMIVDSDFPSPLRSNISRKVLTDYRVVRSDDDLRKLAAEFDLSFYVNSQMKFLDEYTKKRKQDQDQEHKLEKDVQTRK